MKGLIEQMVRSIVSNPEAVTIKETSSEGTSIFEINVAASDRGRIIGKEGRTAKAMRTIIIAAATMNGKRALLEIRE